MDRTLTALIFPTEDGAETALDTIKSLSTRNLIKLHDAGIVWWPAGARRPRTSQLHAITETLALGGALGGLLLGLLFAAPVLGVAAGAVMGAASGNWMKSVSDLGIDRDFVDGVRQKVEPGTSALFLLTSDANLDAVVSAFHDFEFDLFATNLSDHDQKRLRALFAAKRSRGQAANGRGRDRHRGTSSF